VLPHFAFASPHFAITLPHITIAFPQGYFAETYPTKTAFNTKIGW